jgi:hypothetical protein
MKFRLEPAPAVVRDFCSGHPQRVFRVSHDHRILTARTKNAQQAHCVNTNSLDAVAVLVIVRVQLALAVPVQTCLEHQATMSG